MKSEMHILHFCGADWAATLLGALEQLYAYFVEIVQLFLSLVTVLGSIHTLFVHSIFDHFDIDSINAAFLYPLYIDAIPPYSTSHVIRCRIHRIFVIKLPVQKVSSIDRVYIKVIDRRIRNRMDKMTMNRPSCFKILLLQMSMIVWMLSVKMGLRVEIKSMTMNVSVYQGLQDNYVNEVSVFSYGT